MNRRKTLYTSTVKQVYKDHLQGNMKVVVVDMGVFVGRLKYIRNP